MFELFSVEHSKSLEILKICWFIRYTNPQFVPDLHGMGELTFAQGWYANREYRGRFPQWPQTHVVVGGHFWRDLAKAGQGQDEVS